MQAENYQYNEVTMNSGGRIVEDGPTRKSHISVDQVVENGYTYEVPIYQLKYISGRLGKDELVCVHIVENG